MRQFLRKFRNGFLTALCLAGIISAHSLAVTINVPADQPTIQAGIDAAVTGDTVLVAPGTYFERLVCSSKGIKLIGAGADVTILRRAQGSECYLIRFNGFGYSGERAEFAGFTLNGDGRVPAIGIVDLETYVHDNIIRNCESNAVLCARTNPLISRNVFYNNAGVCVWVARDADNTRIVNNTFDRNVSVLRSQFTGGFASNNIIINSTGAGVVRSNNFTALDYNLVWNNNPDYDLGGGGVNDVHLEPAFVYELANDYRLLPLSPGVNEGDPDPQFNDSDGSRNDIGAYDHAASTPLPLNLNLGDSQFRFFSNAPQFFWSYFDTAATQQTAYEIEVGADREWSFAEMWSSGEILSSDTSSIPYSGAPLLRAVDYFARVRIRSGASWGDWITIEFRRNSAPFAPTLLEPMAGDTPRTNAVSLILQGGWDWDADIRTYEFEIYEDSILNLLHTKVDGISAGLPQQAGSVAESERIVGLLPWVEYFWRGRGFDGFQYSPWSALASFTPSAPIVITVPTDFATIQEGINASTPGDTVMVSPGTYTTNIDYGNKVVCLVGAGNGQTILQPADISIPIVTIIGFATNGSLFAGFNLTGGSPNVRIVLSSVTVTDNVFQNNNGRYVIDCSNASAHITRNLFYDNFVDACIAIGLGDQGTLIINNTFDGNRFALRSESGGKVINNIITNSSSGGIISHHFETLEYNNVWNNIEDYSQGGETNSISVDPEFMDRANHDYRLKPSSPCIDAGNPDTVYNDIDGSRNDMGAFPTGSLVCCVDPGDANDDGSVNISDVTFLIARIFAGGAGSTCAGQADANGSGKVNIADVTFLINRIFAGGPPPVCGTTGA